MLKLNNLNYYIYLPQSNSQFSSGVIGLGTHIDGSFLSCSPTNDKRKANCLCFCIKNLFCIKRTS